jgi:glycosyltransferase involved in cell wall biosynthesis
VALVSLSIGGGVFHTPALDGQARPGIIRRAMILFLHHRYRLEGGEERAVEDFARLVREELDEPVEVLERRSGSTGRGRAALGVLAGGLEPEQVACAVRRTGARIVHAHNLHPTWGWRALAAARHAGAGVVLHLHQYRLVCAIGICHRDGEDCLRCHGRNTLPGVRLNCRGSLPEALAYGAGLALWQPRMTGHADAVIVPSRFACERLRALGAPVREPVVLPHPVWAPADEGQALADEGQAPADEGQAPADEGQAPADEGQAPADDGPVPGAADRGRPGATPRFALLAGRLVAEKGVEVAVRACALAGLPLVVAGEGPERARLEPGYPPPAVRFLGRLDRASLAAVRRTAAIELMPSLSAESFGLAAAEAMAAGLPVAASAVGALPELVPSDWLVTPGDAHALAGAITRIGDEPGAGRRARAQVEALAAPTPIAARLAVVYDDAARAASRR